MKYIKASIIGAVIGIIGILAVNYVVLQPIGLWFRGFYIYLLILLGCIIGANAFSSMSKGFFEKTKALTISSILFAVVLVGLIVMQVWGARLFHSGTYRDMIGKVEEKTFSDEVDEVDMSQLPTVDLELAKNLADKKLGSEVALGSVETLGEGTLQNVNGKLMYVFPLEHNGFWKYMSNKDGTSGYITVSATNSSDVKLVQKIDGKTLKIQYQPGAYFSRDLARYVYNHADKTYAYTDYTFEIDDAGVPYWTVTMYRPSCGFGANKVTGLLTVNAQTGKIATYALDKIPGWVDRVYPKEFISTQIADWGEYVHGVFNFSNTDKLMSTEGEAYLYYKGDCYLYSGITSVGADDSTVGFLLTDLKSHKSTFYKIAGATEEAGKSSMEGKVQEKGYTADFPYLINVEGVPTYFSPLKDKKGLVKMYAFCSVEEYSIVGVGESLSAAKTNYIKALQEQGDSLNIDKDADLQKITGTVDRIGSAVSDGYSNFYIILKEYPDKIFIGSESLSLEIPVTQVGDKVTLEYNKTDNDSADMRSYDNLNVK